MSINVVLGVGFGDESKGVTVNSICKDSENTLVIRFNGGHNCGHTVVHNNIRHVFSNFGSSTLKGVPTYWTEYCTLNPKAILKEGDALRAQGIEPTIFYDANAMVTTPYDIYYNIVNEVNCEHGTVGVGFGATIQRNEDHYHLYARDLLYPKIRDEKLRMIRDYTFKKMNTGIINDSRLDVSVEEFKLACDNLVQRFKILNTFNEIQTLLNNYDLVFEGGQGILLDSNFGFFPHVTRSNTTSKNAMELIKKWGLEDQYVKIYYITRAYQTRHGNGYMTNEGLDISYIKENPNETNTDHGMQGKFRKSVLDLDLLKYAISCDSYYHNNLDYEIVMTCLDQVPTKIPVTIKGELVELDTDEIAEYFGLFHLIECHTDKGFKIY